MKLEETRLIAEVNPLLKYIVNEEEDTGRNEEKEEEGRALQSNWSIKIATLDPFIKSAALDPVN